MKRTIISTLFSLSLLAASLLPALSSSAQEASVNIIGGEFYPQFAGLDIAYIETGEGPVRARSWASAKSSRLLIVLQEDLALRDIPCTLPANGEASRASGIILDIRMPISYTAVRSMTWA